jgi:hypothetical protein
MLRGAPMGHDSSVANYRKQESLSSQTIDFPKPVFRILPPKLDFATEPAEARHEGPHTHERHA